MKEQEIITNYNYLNLFYLTFKNKFKICKCMGETNIGIISYTFFIKRVDYFTDSCLNACISIGIAIKAHSLHMCYSKHCDSLRNFMGNGSVR